MGSATKTNGREGERPASGKWELAYSDWVRRHDTPDAATIAAFQARARRLQDGPLLSLLMPVYNPRPEWLAEAIDSIIAQAYPHWQLCIADDCSTDPRVPEILAEYAKRDARICVKRRERNGHISAASNTALEMAEAEWSVLVDHDDLLPVHALLVVAETLVRFPHARIIYSDEDKLDASTGLRCQAYFKPDWNPELACSYNLISHLGVYPTDLLREVGGFREGFEGSQDYDLALRCIDRIDRKAVLHVPQVLYHWRIHADSTASSNATKPYALDAGARALAEHFQRRGRDAEVASHPSGRYFVTDKGPLPAWHAVMVDGSVPPDGARAFDMGIPPASVRATSVANLRETLAQLPTGDVAVMLGPLCSLPDATGLERLLRMSMQPDVGLVGPKLVSKTGRVVGGGLIAGLGDRLFGAIHYGARADDAGYYARADASQDLSILDGGCLVGRVGVLAALPSGASYGRARVALIDLALRAAATGRRLVWMPSVRAQCGWPTAKNRLAGWWRNRRESRDIARLASQWPDLLRPDPAFNPNLSLESMRSMLVAGQPRVALDLPWFEQEQASYLARRIPDA